MNGLFSIEEAILEISNNTMLFFFGSTALFKYKNLPINIYRVLTDMNVASLGLLIPDLKFDNNLDSDCVYYSPEGNAYSFLIREGGSINNIFSKKPEVFASKTTDRTGSYEYLKNVRGDNPLFDLIYSPSEKKYYSVSDDGFLKNMTDDIDVSTLNTEDILDLALIASQTDTSLTCSSEKINFENSNFKNFNFTSLKFFIETVFTSENPYNALIFLYDAGLLEIIYPFIMKMKGVNQDRELHPEGDVLEHTLHCFQFVKNPSLRLFYGLLLHDLGKTIPSKRKGFYDHSNLGANFVYKILSRYGYNRKFTDEIEFLVKYHMINSFFFRLTKDERKSMFDNATGIDLLKLFKADTLGSVGKLDKYQEIVSILKRDKKIKMIK